MCLILFAHNAHPRYPFVLAANRDEFYDRPTAPASFWQDVPNLLAGKDLAGGGTWLGITRDGRIAALSNYRESPHHRDDARSRGFLPVEFLTGSAPPEEYLYRLKETAHDYCGFNLLFGTVGNLSYFSNRGACIDSIPAGIHGLSNHLLDTEWPKVRTGREALGHLLREENPDPEKFFLLLQNRHMPPDEILPDTGFGIEWERALAPLFIAAPRYGTRSSTVILVDREGEVLFSERSYTSSSEIAGAETFHFTLHREGQHG